MDDDKCLLHDDHNTLEQGNGKEDVNAVTNRYLSTLPQLTIAILHGITITRLRQ